MAKKTPVRPEDASPEQKAKLAEIRASIFTSQCEPINHDDRLEAIRLMWEAMGHPMPQVFVHASPMAAWRADAQMQAGDDEPTRTQLSDSLNSAYSSIWWRVWDKWYDGGEVLGYEYDEARRHLFKLWCWNCPYVIARVATVHCSENMTELHFDEDEQIHNDSGPAIAWSDKFSIWVIGGVQVDEQIVMNPHTQTVKQIQGEQNEEVKRIRIERYGWEPFLANINAKVLDEQVNEIEQTRECLMSGDGMTVLVCACPSTARVYAMEVAPETKTCAEAHKYLQGPDAQLGQCIGAS